jgi:hypothetical protein
MTVERFSLYCPGTGDYTPAGSLGLAAIFYLWNNG